MMKEVLENLTLRRHIEFKTVREISINLNYVIRVTKQKLENEHCLALQRVESWGEPL